MLEKTWKLVRKTFTQWSEDKASRLAASLAYYTIFSIAPVLIIVIAIAGLAFGKDAAQGYIFQQIQGIVGSNSAKAIQDMIAHSRQAGSGVIAMVIGFGALLFGATGVFAELQDSLDTIWNVTPKAQTGILKLVQNRFLSFSMVLGTGFLLLVSLVISAGLAAFGKYFSHFLPGMDFLASIINFLVSFAIVTLLFGLIYKVLPDVRIAWGDVWIGAAATSLLFTVGKSLIGLYLGRSSVSSSYGAAGSLIVVILWVYYSALILFLGAEFTQVYAQHYGSRIEPAPNAVPLEDSADPSRQEPRAAQSTTPPPETHPKVTRDLPPRKRILAGAYGSFVLGVVVTLTLLRKIR
jgi:membrane protein